MQTSLFTIEQVQGELSLELSTKKLADGFARMDFFSRLLHSLSPDENRIWRETSRLPNAISGWPRNIKWMRTGETTFNGALLADDNFDISSYSQILEAALLGITQGVESSTGVKMYRFAITNGDKLTEYCFHTKSRTIAALCVLYDKEPHPRNDLEINIPIRLGPQTGWPLDNSDEIQRTYGDPSKTADELRNEGWSRMGNETAMEVYRERIGGQHQQMYRILKTEQTLTSQMMRSNISRRWKTELYESQHYTCQICLNLYEADYLEPDHRVPVIYEADGLTEENFKEKLMTLCRFCNQQKRETTKRLPHDYDWQNSPWAFPEKFELETAKKKIASYRKRSGKKMAEVIRELKGK